MSALCQKIVDKLNREVNAALADPKITARLTDVVYEPVLMTIADFGKFIEDETEKWAKVIQAAGIKAQRSAVRLTFSEAIIMKLPRRIVAPEAADQRAKDDQHELVERFGGRKAAFRIGTEGATPAPNV